MAVRLIGLLVLAITGLLTLSACNSSHSSAAGHGFVLSQGGRIAISDNSGKTIFLTSGPGDLMPAASPDGSMVAFTRVGPGETAGTYVVKTDGTGEKKIAPNAASLSQPVWSPDNKRVAIRESNQANWGIWVVNADGTNLQCVFDGDCAIPSWSSDGKSIAVAAGQKNAEKSIDPGIYIVDSQSKERKLIAAGNFGPVAWSPDGKTIAAISAAKTGLPTDLVLVEIATGQSKAVSGNISDGIWAPAWSPDGKNIALVIVNKEEQQLVRITSAGSEPKVLAKGSAIGVPVWGSDSKSLVVSLTSADAKTGKVVLVNADGGQTPKEIAAGDAPGFLAKQISITQNVAAKSQLQGIRRADLKLVKGSWG